MIFETRRRRSRRELTAEGYRPAWREIAAEQVPQWDLLDEKSRMALEDRALDLLATKKWEAAHGFTLSEEILVTVASQAALLVLGLPADALREVQAVIVHPTTVVLTGPRTVVPGLVSDGPMRIGGQARYAGPVVIVWDEVLADARRPGNGRCVVLHEMAHKLDMLDGLVDGTPPLDDREQLDRWVEVCTDVFQQVQRGEADPVLRPYAGVNPGEFFAVATEAFFDASLALRDAYPDLYAVLADYYRQDPARRADSAHERPSP